MARPRVGSLRPRGAARRRRRREGRLRAGRTPPVPGRAGRGPGGRLRPGGHRLCRGDAGPRSCAARPDWRKIRDMRRHVRVFPVGFRSAVPGRRNTPGPSVRGAGRGARGLADCAPAAEDSRHAPAVGRGPAVALRDRCAARWRAEIRATPERSARAVGRGRSWRCGIGARRGGGWRAGACPAGPFRGRATVPRPRAAWPRPASADRPVGRICRRPAIPAGPEGTGRSFLPGAVRVPGGSAAGWRGCGPPGTVPAPEGLPAMPARGRQPRGPSRRRSL